jgi:hypothetical protein
VNLHDRIRRWWSPARWKDDHPSQATESTQGENKHWWQGGGWFFRVTPDQSDRTSRASGPTSSATSRSRAKPARVARTGTSGMTTPPSHIKPLADAQHAATAARIQSVPTVARQRHRSSEE